jgi:predicted RNA binding protein YcfA (HicA-like mRNA interferase family)
MTKPMKYRDLAKLLRQSGFTSRPGKGDHEVWSGPNSTQTVVVRDTECSPKVVRDALKAIEKSKEA